MKSFRIFLTPSSCPTRRFPIFLSPFSCLLLVPLSLCILHSALCISQGATVTGDLKDISIQALNTKLLFTPTTNVLVVGSGLSAGPPKMIDTVSGSFSVTLDQGDYTVSLPLI